MKEPILEHLGGRIRLYRKACGMTMEQLAQKVHKTKASISKYESGQTAVDVVTLVEIAEALDITPFQLLDYTPPAKGKAPGGSAFLTTDHLFLYHMNKKKVYTSVATIGERDGVGQSATMFYKVEDLDRLEQCDCIYHGHVHSHAMVLNFVFINYHNPVENILLSFSVPMRKTTQLVGMISGLGANTLEPTAHKIVLSTEPLAEDQKLRELLTISPESFKEMRAKNTLFIPLGE